MEKCNIDMEWDDSSYIKIVKDTDCGIIIEANKNGLLSLARHLKSFAMANSSPHIHLHYQAESYSESEYNYGDLEEGSLNLVVIKKEISGRKKQ
jgi:hypothetical protein